MNALKAVIRFLFKTTTDSRATLQAQLKVLEAQNATNNFRIKELNEQIDYLTKAAQSIGSQVAVANKAIDAIGATLKEEKPDEA